MGIRSSGCDAVDAMRNINFSGNIVPMSWYKKILRENGKPDHFAVTLLSDIVYWYRPTEVRDPVSGYVVSLQKKFDGDLLQKSYDQYANQYGESKRTVKAALDRLEELGLIKKVFRDLKISSTLIPNIMYIQIFPEKIDEITMEVVDDETSGPMVQKSENEDINNECNENENEEESSVYPDSVGGHTKFCTTPYKTLYDLPQNNVPPLTKECRDILQNDVGGLTPDCETYTKNTTEITTKNTTTPTTVLSDAVGCLRETFAFLNLADKDIATIFTASRNNIEKCKRAAELLKQQSNTIRNPVGWLITMVGGDCQQTPYTPKGKSPGYCTRDINFEELEQELLTYT